MCQKENIQSLRILNYIAQAQHDRITFAHPNGRPFNASNHFLNQTAKVGSHT